VSPTVLLADPAVRFAGVRGERRRTRGRRRVRLPFRRLLAALAVLLVIGGLGYLRTWPPLATVMSASMTPTIDTGDMVVLKRISRPRVGDVAAVAVPDEARSRFGYPPVVVHRIVRIGPDGAVTTKGDARKDPDPFTVPASAVRTKVVVAVPAAGRVLAFLTSGLGLLWLAAGGLLLGGLPLLERRQDARRHAEGERDALQAALASVAEELRASRHETQETAAALAELREQTREEARLAALDELRQAREETRAATLDEAREQARAAALDELREAREQAQLVAAALAELPALIERAVADAVAAAPRPAPPAPPAAAPWQAAPHPPAAPHETAPHPPAAPHETATAAPAAPRFVATFAAPAASRFVPASQFKPRTPDLLTVLAPAARWDAPPGHDEPLRRRRFPARAPVPASL